jgi:hypothetical protein
VSAEPYAIAWTAPARHALTRLPEKVATAPVEFLYGSLAANPHRVGNRSSWRWPDSTALDAATTG